MINEGIITASLAQFSRTELTNTGTLKLTGTVLESGTITNSGIFELTKITLAFEPLRPVNY